MLKQHSGELTNKEARRLKRQQADIHRDVHQAKADGVVTGKERAQIYRDQNKANRNIYRAKHNNRDRN